MAVSSSTENKAVRAELIHAIASENSLDLSLYISEELVFFQGHFSGFPILPGIVQVDWAIRYARELLFLTSPVSRIERLKFTCPIQPSMRVNLRIEFNSAQRYSNFHYYSDQASSVEQQLSFSKGRLIYA